MRRSLFALLFLTIVCSITSLSAQDYRGRINRRVVIGDTTQYHNLILVDYSSMIGRVESINNGIIYMRLISADEVSEIPAEELRYLGVYYLAAARDRNTASAAVPGFDNLTYERTALPYHSRGQFRTVLLAYNAFEINLNEHFQIGGGVAGPLGILVNSKYRTSLQPNLHVGLSAQILALPLVTPTRRGLPVVGDLSAITTLGTSDLFLNLGTGLLFNTDGFSETTAWAHRFGAGGKIGRKWHLYGEALFVQDKSIEELTLVPGLSAAYGARRHRWQFGLWTAFTEFENIVPPPIPWVGYSLYW